MTDIELNYEEESKFEYYMDLSFFLIVKYKEKEWEEVIEERVLIYWETRCLHELLSDFGLNRMIVGKEDNYCRNFGKLMKKLLFE